MPVPTCITKMLVIRDTGKCVANPYGGSRMWLNENLGPRPGNDNLSKDSYPYFYALYEYILYDEMFKHFQNLIFREQIHL